MNGTPLRSALANAHLIMQALAAGVVPRQGLRHIQVDRAAEVSALINDIERIAATAPRSGSSSASTAPARPFS